MTVKLGMRVFWNHGPMPVTTRKTARLAMTVPFGTVMNLSGNGSGGAVNSVNGQTGSVMLNATDVGADVAGSAQAVSDVLQPQITINTDAVAMLTAMLSALQAAKADVTYVNQQIATLVGTDAQTLAAIQSISDALAENEDLLEALDQTVANRVRFDVATQGLTALQKYNARTNIGAEESGTAALLIGQITAASIGAVTASQLAAVAFSGSYNDLSDKPAADGGGITITDVKNENLKFVKLNPYNSVAPTAPSATGNQATALGYGSIANGAGTSSFGYGAKAQAENATAIGFGAQTNSIATGSIAVGKGASSQGLYEVVMGYEAGTALGYGVAIGISASARNQSVAVGGFSQAQYANSTSLGYGAQCTATNQVQLGNSSTTTYAYGAVQNRSDIRDKTDIAACDLGLDFINTLQPRKWVWDYRDDYAQTLFPVLIRTDFTDDEAYQSALTQQDADRAAFYANPVKDGSKARHRYHYGLVAQELKATLDALGIDYAAYQDHSIEGGLDVKSIGYNELIAPLIKAVQELSARVVMLESKA
ncbi:MAG: hypothetical protein EOO69_04430 [Moraxellaceae bacterium]|nr:MAG: hypothetical protein EOO69_04430 [Moraxellaceae bacterium]